MVLRLSEGLGGTAHSAVRFDDRISEALVALPELAMHVLCYGKLQVRIRQIDDEPKIVVLHGGGEAERTRADSMEFS